MILLKRLRRMTACFEKDCSKKKKHRQKDNKEIKIKKYIISMSKCITGGENENSRIDTH